LPQQDRQAYELVNADASPSLVFVSDHASNALPAGYGTLGLPPEDFARHIAFDIGAADVTRAMADAFAAPAVLGRYSRLLIDLNRGTDDPTLVMKLSDGAIISGNVTVGTAEINRRIIQYYQPYHDAIESLVARAKAQSLTPCIVSIHSFTPEWRGVARPWQIGVLWSRKDPRLAQALLAVLRAESDLVIGDNQPYSGELDGDCMEQHAIAHGFPHVLIEIRQDLIADKASAKLWADRLVPLLRRAIADMGISAASISPDAQRTELEAATFRRLVDHLRQRTDVQNIDLMNLAGFCRNCLGNWYAEAATERGVSVSRDNARERVYGMPYAEWKARFQKEASAEQKSAFELSHKNHG
jgi:predicted N-formylglutamate amidohydrolase